MPKERYTLCRVYQTIKSDCLGFNYKCLKTEEFPCKTLKEAIEMGSILTYEEKINSYIFDNVRHKRLTLKGEQ